MLEVFQSYRKPARAHGIPFGLRGKTVQHEASVHGLSVGQANDILAIAASGKPDLIFGLMTGRMTVRIAKAKLNRPILFAVSAE
jgi:hypothetical protein